MQPPTQPTHESVDHSEPAEQDEMRLLLNDPTPLSSPKYHVSSGTVFNLALQWFAVLAGTAVSGGLLYWLLK